MGLDGRSQQMIHRNKDVIVSLALGLIWIFSACSSDNTDNDSDGLDENDTSGCTREKLKATIDAYYEALEAHDPSALSLASNVKYTENGVEMQVGEGLWKTAGSVKFKRSALDTETCNSVTESTIAEAGGDIVLGLRLKLEDNQITEIEAIPVRRGDYMSEDIVVWDPANLIATASDDWETVLDEDERPTREQLANIIDTYFTQFPNGACNFSDDCTRVEDGHTISVPCLAGMGCTDAGTGDAVMVPRLHVLDVEAGIAVGFTMFIIYTDFHMFKVRNGQVVGVHAVLALASDGSGWD